MASLILKLDYFCWLNDMTENQFIYHLLLDK